MYKSRAIPVLDGANAEYFTEIQRRMENEGSRKSEATVGKGVQAVMSKAGDEAWAI